MFVHVHARLFIVSLLSQLWTLYCLEMAGGCVSSGSMVFLYTPNWYYTNNGLYGFRM